MFGSRKVSMGFTAVLLAIVAACSEPTRYRVLSFFLDGVPPPGSQPSAAPAPGAPPLQTVEAAKAVTPQRILAHTPYRENRCGGCHDVDSGQLVRSVPDGLCLTCHGPLTDRPYVHGPAAVNDCTMCHHYHGSTHPNLLLNDVVTTCQNCHDRGDLSSGDHHTALDARACTDCHDPHGGTNRYFVKGPGP